MRAATMQAMEISFKVRSMNYINLFKVASEL
jgi:hypothetical protein